MNTAKNARKVVHRMKNLTILQNIARFGTGGVTEKALYSGGIFPRYSHGYERPSEGEGKDSQFMPSYLRCLCLIYSSPNV